MDDKIEQTLRQLQRNRMTGYFAESREEVTGLLSKLLRPGETVGCGDSVTLEQLGVYDFLRNGDFVFLDKYREGLSPEEKRELYIKNFSADTFLTGTNAVTRDGRLFNIDGNGSRVAPMVYGPKQVIVVIGVNKIVGSVQEAVERARQVAAPLDAKRLGKNTPCAKLGRCVDCRHEQRICNDFVLITGNFDKNRFKIILVNETLGY
ncbi:lactate utilization protein [Caproiciproducens sp. CPB-2]|uniref:lactate utilization protein n=1 Tax=Caproiciproducens sp. CPB-2 TaxID=3030017 RepID=UPI0023DBEEBD|nr:lactate utilization protein [Caproiciproducens sp. CPB-2]MDF1494609.1 lactate utilization protein [Caproiciproducens sp. CPB-2]